MLVHQGQGFGQHAQAFLDLSFPAQGFGQQGEEVGPVRADPGGRPGVKPLAQLGDAAGPRPLLGQGPPAHDQAARSPERKPVLGRDRRVASAFRWTAGPSRRYCRSMAAK